MVRLARVKRELANKRVVKNRLGSEGQRQAGVESETEQNQTATRKTETRDRDKRLSDW